MAERLGNVLYLVGCAFALLFLALLCWSAAQPLPNPAISLTLWGAFAAGSWAIGRGLKYILAGR